MENSFLKSRIPKQLLKIDDLVIFNFHAFAFEQLLHQVRAVEMVFAREHADAIHDAVRRDIFALARRIHRPADHSRRTRTAQNFSDRAIGRDFAIWNLPRDVVHAFEEIVVVGIFLLSQNKIRVC